MDKLQFRDGAIQEVRIHRYVFPTRTLGTREFYSYNL